MNDPIDSQRKSEICGNLEDIFRKDHINQTTMTLKYFQNIIARKI